MRAKEDEMPDQEENRTKALSLGGTPSRKSPACVTSSCRPTWRSVWPGGRR